jgi:hypothetical protein
MDLGGRPVCASANLLSTRMPWTRKFAEPITLKDGRTIATLGEAREMMLSVPPYHRQGAVWRYAAELLDEAAADRASVVEVEEILWRGLRTAGLI